MIYEFDDVELDLDRFELRRAGTVVPVEPQVFSLLSLLVENHERMVSRDEIVERIWDGRIISEAAISSRIKAVRRAVGDNGQRQHVIKTVHGRGFRCIAAVRIGASANASGAKVDAQLKTQPPADPGSDAVGRQSHQISMPSIAVLPFGLQSTSDAFFTLAEALPHEIINALSRLRWLKVIARGSSFRFREPNPDVLVVGAALGARYCLSGFIQLDDLRISVSVELAETSDGRVIWSETYGGLIGDVLALRASITSGVVSALENHVPMNEARVARMSQAENLDAWAVYHLGVQRMFRFSSSDNAAAAEYFREALRLEPGLARAYAGLSFTRFLEAYHGFSEHRDRSALEAKEFAEKATSLDPLDPFANFTLGRAHWLEGDMEASLGWLDRGIALSPSYAQCVYARGFADTLLGDTRVARPNLERAIGLSPLDPFLYAMKGTIGITYLLESDYGTAVTWLDQAGRTPGSPAVVGLVAAVAHIFNGEESEALQWIARARKQSPAISVEQFYKATPMANAQLRSEMSEMLRARWTI